MNFNELIQLFHVTHIEMQFKASRSVDLALVVRNWLFGWYIVEFENGGAERAELYGKKLLNKLSEKLKKLDIKGVSVTNLKQCRTFYMNKKIGQTVSDQSLSFKIKQSEIGQTPSDQSSEIIHEIIHSDKKHITNLIYPVLAKHFSLGWSQHVTLLTIENKEERNFYEIEAVKNSWSVRELKRQVDSSLYERLVLSRDKEKIKELSQHGLMIEQPSDVIKNPYVLEFLDIKEHHTYTEHELETAIIDRLENFLLELGKGFLFEARQKRFTFDDDHFYVDLVFYNRLLRCYVLIDLKRNNLTHQDLGQMQMYVNYFDRYVKITDELPTIGILYAIEKMTL